MEDKIKELTEIVEVQHGINKLLGDLTEIVKQRVDLYKSQLFRIRDRQIIIVLWLLLLTIYTILT